MPATISQITFLILPLQVQRGPVVVGGAGLGGEVPAALSVGSHHVGVRRQSWKQTCWFISFVSVPVPAYSLVHSLTVASESLRLGFYILDVDVKVLRRGGSRIMRAEVRARLVTQPTAGSP